MNRNGPVGEETETLPIYGSFDEAPIVLGALRIEEGRHNSQPTDRWCGYAANSEFSSQQAVRNLSQDSGAIAGSISCLGASVLEPDQAFDGQPGEAVGGAQIA
jgi:hypothetical protein